MRTLFAASLIPGLVLAGGVIAVIRRRAAR